MSKKKEPEEAEVHEQAVDATSAISSARQVPGAKDEIKVDLHYPTVPFGMQLKPDI